MDPSSLDQRIVRMETRIAYQDRLLGNLDDVVREFSGRIDTLECHVRALRAALHEAGDIGTADDPPPHY